MSENTTEKPKPYMIVDERMKETHMVPIHPETGEIWDEKWAELQRIGADIQFTKADDNRQELERDYAEAAKGVEFREEPLFKKSLTSHSMGWGVDERETFHCHPNTWDKLGDEQKAQYEMIPVFRMPQRD